VPVHELSICQSLLREVRRVADAHDSQEVTGIVVAVGAISGVEPMLLQRAFTIARAGTVAENATLEIEDMPVTVWCASCGVETPATANGIVCGQCGTWKVDLRSGDELLLKRVELTSTEDTAAMASG
jgi:hydrogenase nickel incorporation protein HypA/HybF